MGIFVERVHCRLVRRPFDHSRPPRRRLGLCALLLGTLALLLGSLPLGFKVTGQGTLRTAHARTSALNPALARRIRARLKKAGVRANSSGVALMALGERSAVVCADGHMKSLVPASASKLFTAAAALDHLGPTYQFTTRVDVRGRFDKATGTLHGDLVVRGGGDPNISGRLYKGKHLYVLQSLAKQVRGAGIRRVTGALLLDEGGFDRVFTHATWTKADKRRYYGAAVGGLSLNDNCLEVAVRGGPHVGAKATVSFPATSGPWSTANAVTTSSKSKTVVGGVWTGGGKTFRVQGSVPVKKLVFIKVPVPDPGLYFGGAFRRVLRKSGITIGESMRRVGASDDLRALQTVARHRSSLRDALRIMNQSSNNFYASMIFKLCGHAYDGVGSWESGTRAVGAMLVRRGILTVEDDDVLMLDGSGLSVKNKATAGALAQMLASFSRDPVRGPLLFESLAVAGKSGTLRRRLKGKSVSGRVFAKTGTLNDVRSRALAGYFADGNGAPSYAFAILLNGRGSSHGVIDDVVRIISGATR